MTDLHTDPLLLDRIKQAARRVTTVEERQQQRVSFILSGLPDDSTVTRKDVEKILNEDAA